MDQWKWLYPGMKVKRWLVLMTFGVFLIGLGLTILFNTQLLAKVEQKMLWVITHHIVIESWLAGSVVIVVGSFFVVLGMRSTIRSLVDALAPQEVSKLADVVYRKRSLQKGPQIVVIGGGTGLATMLRGLKRYSSNITAIVTVADNGGSSGRIREDLGILPPGDIRNTLIALAETEPLMEKLFQYRFTWGEGLTGHSFGNLFIAAMTDITGDFEVAIREFSKVLAVTGRVIPSTLEAIQLSATYTDGTKIVGESQIPRMDREISRVCLIPDDASALSEAVDAIVQADIVVLGPGSLYTSVIPNLLVTQILEALLQTDALRVYVCNVMTQPGETDKMSASDHVAAILRHTNMRKIIDYVLVNNSPISQKQARIYQKKQAFPIKADLEAIKKLNITPIGCPLLSSSDLVRHDAEKLASELLKLALIAQGKNEKGRFKI